MITETPVEYFYGETLRWSFGFENPNKAAVLFACAVPLLWYLWQMSWRLKKKWLKIPALLVAASGLLAAWYCLIMTYSRGGLVAAAAALLYVIGHDAWRRIKQKPPQPMRVEIGFSIPLVAALAAIILWSGLAARSTEALGKDASVGNRIELWSSALQMAAENIHGFGTGKSGEQYMQWYQPLERQEGYRTMVNSYLTFLVEQGWMRSGALMLGFVLFWVWTRPRGEESITVALRASIVAFLVAGIFSTTMEDWRLWLIPGACGASLTLLAIYQRKCIEKSQLWVTGGCVLASCTALFTIGFLKSGKDSLKREFGSNGSSHSVTTLAPSAPTGRAIGCLIDESVMGDQYAKLLREMSLNAHVKIMLGNRVKDADRILITGNSIHSVSSYSQKPLLLLAPEKILETELTALTQRSETLKILLPEIDEDGRVDFWDAVSEGAFAANFQKTALVGVGNRVDWAWAQVIDLVKAN
jgi:O-Antigen ligase